MAIDNTGAEFVLSVARMIDAPTEAETRAGAWYLVLHAPTDPASPQGILAWRDPLVRSGARQLNEGRDVVLASVTFKAGKFDSLDASVRRPIRPAAAPSVSASTTGAGVTVWQPWYNGQPPSRGAMPTGIKTHVPENVAGRVVLAQLTGTRRDPNSHRSYDGPSFVVNSGTAGFDFVILFPNGLQSWGLSSNEALSHLLDKLKDPMQWSVSWVSVTQSQQGANSTKANT
jgi:hypothetical protein